MKPLAAELKQEFDIYRSLSSLDLYLSNWGLFGIFNTRRKLLVDDRAFKCWFLLKSQKPQYLNIKIATDGPEMIREAMHARVKYFNWRMKEITGAHSFTRGRRGSRKRFSYFFADPLKKIERQRLWLKPPEEAKFVVLTFERGDYTTRLGFSSKIKLKAFDEKAGAKDLCIAYRDIMKSRDRMRMTWFIERLKNEARTIYHAASDHAASDQGVSDQGVGNGNHTGADYGNSNQDKDHRVDGNVGNQTNERSDNGTDTQDQLTPVQMARSMLAHMVYLWQGVEEKRAMMVIDDAVHLTKNGFTLDRGRDDNLSLSENLIGQNGLDQNRIRQERETQKQFSGEQANHEQVDQEQVDQEQIDQEQIDQEMVSQTQSDGNHFEYDTILISQWERTGLMSSQMRLEAMYLMQAMNDRNADTVVLRKGRQYLARLMVAVAVARQTGWFLKLDVSETLWSEQTFGEWCRWRSLLDWLVTSKLLTSNHGNMELIVKDTEQLTAIRVAGIDQYISMNK